MRGIHQEMEGICLRELWMNGVIRKIIRCVLMHVPIIHSQTHCFVHISPVTIQMPLVSFASYRINHPLSAHAFQLMVCCLDVKLFPCYCLFGNTWCNLLSGAYYGLCCYMGCLWLKGTSYSTLFLILHYKDEMLLALGE